jgi:hypothetical protein
MCLWTPPRSWPSSTMRTTRMKRKKRTPEEVKAWREAREARLRELEYWIERGKAELAAKRKLA